MGYVKKLSDYALAGGSGGYRPTGPDTYVRDAQGRVVGHVSEYGYSGKISGPSYQDVNYKAKENKLNEVKTKWQNLFTQAHENTMKAIEQNRMMNQELSQKDVKSKADAYKAIIEPYKDDPEAAANDPEVQLAKKALIESLARDQGYRAGDGMQVGEFQRDPKSPEKTPFQFDPSGRSVQDRLGFIEKTPQAKAIAQTTAAKVSGKKFTLKDKKSGRDMNIEVPPNAEAYEKDGKLMMKVFIHTPKGPVQYEMPLSQITKGVGAAQAKKEARQRETNELIFPY